MYYGIVQAVNCFQFLLGPIEVRRENINNAYAIFFQGQTNTFSIHLISKWPSFRYSFVFIQISP